jgi:hypothetical protein
MLNWKIAYAENHMCKDMDIKTIIDIEKNCFENMQATVPGTIEIDLMKQESLMICIFQPMQLMREKLKIYMYGIIRISRQKRMIISILKG